MGEMRLRLTKKHSKLLQRILAFTLALILICPDAGMLGGVIAKADEVSDSITLTVNRIGVADKDSRGKVIREGDTNFTSWNALGNDELYVGNNAKSIGNATEQTSVLYMDSNSVVELEYDSSVPFETIFVTAEKKTISGSIRLDSSNPDGGSTMGTDDALYGDKYIYYEMRPNTFNDKKGRLIISSAKYPGTGNEYDAYILFLPTDSSSSGYSFLLRVAVLTPTSGYNVGQSSPEVRQGQSRSLGVEAIKDHTMGTDGYNWSVLKDGTDVSTNESGYNITTDDNKQTNMSDALGSVAPLTANGHSSAETNRATFSTYADREKVGNAWVLAETTSGLSVNEERNSCIALKRRKLQCAVRFYVSKWYRANQIGFMKGGQEYKLHQIGEDNTYTSFVCENRATSDDSVLTYNFLTTNPKVDLGNLIVGHTGVPSVSDPNKEQESNDEFRYFVDDKAVSLSNGKYEYGFGTAKRYKVTVKGETEGIESSCYVVSSKSTSSLKLYVNEYSSGNDVATTSLRYNNEVLLLGVEDSGANEPLFWTIDENEESEYLSFTEVTDGFADNVKAFRVKVIKNPVTKKTLKLTLSTNRLDENGERTNNDVLSTIYMDIYPPLTEEIGLKTLYTPVLQGYEDNTQIVTLGSDNEIDLYTEETAEVANIPAKDGEENDQIIYEVTDYPQYINKVDQATEKTKTTITWVAQAAAGTASVLTAQAKSSWDTSTSAYKVSKGITIHTKASTKSVKLALRSNEATTPSVEKNGEYYLDATVTSNVADSGSDETLYWESESPNKVVFLDGDAEVSSLNNAGTSVKIRVKDAPGTGEPDPVIRVYPMHIHGKDSNAVEHKSAKSYAITLKVIKADDIVVEPNDWTPVVGGTQKFTAKVYQNNALVSNPTINWSTVSGNSVITMDYGTNTATANKVGDSAVFAKFGEAIGEAAVKVTYPINGKDTNDTNITLSGVYTKTDEQTADSYVYLPNGAKQDITPVITSKNFIDARADEEGNYTLVEGEDYEVTDSFTEGKGVGTYSFSFGTGANGYYIDAGKTYPKRVVNYRIWQKNLNSEGISVKENGKLTYNGKTQEPDLTITYTKGDLVQELVKGTDYTTAGAQTAAGNGYALTITGKGNFAGSITYTYNILQYNIKENFGEDVMFRKGNATTGELVSQNSITDLTYLASQQEPTVYVSAKLIKDVETWTPLNNKNTNDLDLEYSDNEDVGTATITINGKGNYTGQITTTFQIVPKDISSTANNGSVAIATIANQTFTGFEINPELTVSYAVKNVTTKPLVEGVDYEVVYDNNIVCNTKNTPAPTVTISGKGNYTGTKSATFTIVPADMSNAALVVIDDIPDQKDCATELTPPINVNMGGYHLVEGRDYTVYYGNGVDNTYNMNPGKNKGVVTIVPVANSNFTASGSPALTVRTKLKGQEKFFNIIDGAQGATKAASIEIEGDTGLINDKIYVNTSGSVQNASLTFTIRSLDAEGNASNDPIYAVREDSEKSYYNLTVKNTSSGGNANEAEITIIGAKAGNSRVKLQTLQGLSRYVEVIVREPAKTVSIKQGSTVVSGGGQTGLLDFHEYELTAAFNTTTATDSVEWAFDEQFATVSDNGICSSEKATLIPMTEDGKKVKLTTLGTGRIYIYVRTKPSEVSDGGVNATAVFNISDSNLATDVYIKQAKGTDPITKERIKLNGTLDVTGVATGQGGSTVTEELYWKSSDDSIVSIGTGTTTVRLTAKKTGKATITYGSMRTDDDGNPLGLASLEVEVYVDPTSVTLDKSQMVVIYGKEASLTASVDEGASDEFVWTSSDPEAVSITVDDHDPANSQTVKLTGKKPNAEATITVSLKNYPKIPAKTCKVTVTHSKATAVSIEATGDTVIDVVDGKKTITAHVGDVINLKGTATNGTQEITERIYWGIGYGDVLTFNDGYNDSMPEISLTASKAGNVVVAYGGEKRAEVIVYVIEDLKGISFDQSALEIIEGTSKTLTASCDGSQKGKAKGSLNWEYDKSLLKIEGIADGQVQTNEVTVTALKNDTTDIKTTIKITSVEDPTKTAVCNVTIPAKKQESTNPSGNDQQGGTQTNPSGGDNPSNPSGSGDQQGTVQNPDQKPADGQQQKPEEVTAPKTGESRDVDGLTYKATGSDTVAFVAPAEGSTTSKVKIPATITIGGQTYKVTEVKDGAFEGRTDIKSITIGANVEKIGNNAFKGCTELTKVVIPKKVKSIGKNAFAGCKKLKTVQIKTLSLKKIAKGAFKTIKKGATIKVPKSKKAAYKKLLKKSGLPKGVRIK
ncbi:MAG: leucine-rich repeat protein [Lachnospiraceae bacterium]|nr:leucine-rich repeat protein [Lachnospiraceae bacterium]